MFHRFLLFAMLCLGFASPAHAINKRISLKRALIKNIISVKAISTGGFYGKSIKLQLANRTDTEYEVTVDPGLIFTPADSSYQDLVLMGNETIVLGPCSDTAMNFQTFCGKSYAHSPVPNISYKFWKQGDTSMVKMLNYAHTQKTSIWLIQRAVWMFTNNHSLNSIYDPFNPGTSEEFVKYVASLKKLPVPEFYKKYTIDDRPGRPAMTSEAKFYVTMQWGHEGYRHMYLDILKENGDLYKRIEADRFIDKYGNTVQVEFDPKRDPKGRYTVLLHDDSKKEWGRKQVVVD